jgi:hypothetical protein
VVVDVLSAVAVGTLGGVVTYDGVTCTGFCVGSTGEAAVGVGLLAYAGLLVGSAVSGVVSTSECRALSAEDARDHEDAPQ